ncbi:MAG: acyl-CoA dehydrogenase family protein [Burkholderiaceae bacterium]|jgi:acyl-CoA dehydrogenase
MDLNYSEQDNAFRLEVRNWLKENLPRDLQHKVLNHLRLNKEEYARWHKILAKKGWVAPSWPVQWGGTGWNATQRHIFEEECGAAGTPMIMAFGVAMVAPVLMKFGSEAQKQYYLPRIYDCTDWWCQGYSEPGSGSDLASLKTRAEPQGDHYVVNGQKTWTTLAQFADMMFCLVRTETTERRQEGITFLLIDMKTPGITVRPILTLDEDHEVNEVFFDNVRVPVGNRVGEEGKGWTYAKYLLGHERTGIAAVGRSKRELAFLKRIASDQKKNGRALLEDPLFASKVANLEIELMALEMTVLRVVSAEGAHKGPGPEASLLKIKGTEIQQGLTELMLEAIGPYGMPFEREYLEGRADHALDDDAAPLAAYYFNFRKTSIYGGSNEIQKNIISQMILGL